MGSYFKKAIFNEHIQEGLVGWAKKGKKRKEQKTGTNDTSIEEPSANIELRSLMGKKDPLIDEGKSSHGEESML